MTSLVLGSAVCFATPGRARDPTGCIQAKRWFESLPLQLMTYLELNFSPVNEITLKSLVRVLWGAHEMQKVKVNAIRNESEVSWPLGLLGLPPRGKYEFHCNSSAKMDAVLPKLKEDGFIIQETKGGMLTCEYPVAAIPSSVRAPSGLLN